MQMLIAATKHFCIHIKDNTSAQQYYFIAIKVSNKQHVSTNQVVIIRSITEIYRIEEGCAHIWDPISNSTTNMPACKH